MYITCHVVIGPRINYPSILATRSNITRDQSCDLTPPGSHTQTWKTLILMEPASRVALVEHQLWTHYLLEIVHQLLPCSLGLICSILQHSLLVFLLLLVLGMSFRKAQQAPIFFRSMIPPSTHSAPRMNHGFSSKAWNLLLCCILQKFQVHLHVFQYFPLCLFLNQ